MLASNGSSFKEISINETCFLNMRMAASAWFGQGVPGPREIGRILLPAVIALHFSAHKSLIGNNVFGIQLINFKVLLKMRYRHCIRPILNYKCSSQ